MLCRSGSEMDSGDEDDLPISLVDFSRVKDKWLLYAAVFQFHSLLWRVCLVLLKTGRWRKHCAFKTISDTWRTAESHAQAHRWLWSCRTACDFNCPCKLFTQNSRLKIWYEYESYISKGGRWSVKCFSKPVMLQGFSGGSTTWAAIKAGQRCGTVLLLILKFCLQSKASEWWMQERNSILELCCQRTKDCSTQGHLVLLWLEEFKSEKEHRKRRLPEETLKSSWSMRHFCWSTRRK